MSFVQSPRKQETDEKFGRVWFAALARFHKIKNPQPAEVGAPALPQGTRPSFAWAGFLEHCYN